MDKWPVITVCNRKTQSDMCVCVLCVCVCQQMWWTGLRQSKVDQVEQGRMYYGKVLQRRVDRLLQIDVL